VEQQCQDKWEPLVCLEAKIVDSADHAETVSRTYPVSDRSIRVALLPEAGRMVPDMENRLFVAAQDPDGSPAACDVSLWLGKEAASLSMLRPFAIAGIDPEVGKAFFYPEPDG
jgi:hypothetical protein